MSTAPVDYDAQMRQEFRDQTQDRLAGMNAALDEAREGNARPDMQTQLARDTQNIKGLAGGYGYPVTNMVAQRLEIYLAALDTVDGSDLLNIQAYLDRIGDLAERGEPTEPMHIAALLQGLPSRYQFDVNDVVVKKIEIMLVTPGKVVAKLVAGEMAACGFKPVIVHDPLEALAQAVRVPPGMVLASVVMEPINGVELVRALKLMRATRACPMAVLTSLDADHKPLNDLPPEVAIIHSGPEFGADFAAATSKFNLG